MSVHDVVGESGSHLLSPHPRAVTLDGRVPLEELVLRDLIKRLDISAILTRLHKVKLVTVVNHATLGGGGGRDAVAGARGLGWRRRSVPNNGDAGVCIRPKTRAGGSNFRVPSLELGQSNAVGAGNSATLISLFHQVEGVTVAHHIGLRGLGGRDACKSQQ